MNESPAPATPATRPPRHPSPVAVPTLVEHTEEGFTARQSTPSRSPYQDLPIYPGVFFIESVVNASRAYVRLRGIEPGAVSLSRVENVRFVSPGTPGESFTVVARLEDPGGGPGTRRVSASCRDERGRVLAEMALRLAPDA